ncbi:MAG TPA: hypothetical protein VF730_11450 [Terracidiphilus sp.]
MPPDAVAKTPQEQLEEDCANLLKMTQDLKAEMDRTNPDTLSLTVVHKAMAIEQLSHKIQQEMKDEAGKPSAREPDEPGHEAKDKSKRH